jgi:hypothetical protein
MPYRSMPYRRATSEIALWPHSPSGEARLQGKQLAAILYPFGHPTPYAYEFRTGKKLGRVSHPIKATESGTFWNPDP